MILIINFNLFVRQEEYKAIIDFLCTNWTLMSICITFYFSAICLLNDDDSNVLQANLT